MRVNSDEKRDPSHLVALLVVALIHLLFYALLALPPGRNRIREEASIRTALIFLEPRSQFAAPKLVDKSPEPKIARQVESILRRKPMARTPRPVDSLVDIASEQTEQVGTSLSSDEMLRNWADGSETKLDFKQDPFKSRVAKLPGGTRRGSIRVSSNSPQRILRMIGGIVGGKDYDPDPCPRNRQNIAALSTSTDEGERAALMRELEFDREHCRP